MLSLSLLMASFVSFELLSSAFFISSFAEWSFFISWSSSTLLPCLAGILSLTFNGSSVSWFNSRLFRLLVAILLITNVCDGYLVCS